MQPVTPSFNAHKGCGWSQLFNLATKKKNILFVLLISLSVKDDH